MRRWVGTRIVITNRLRQSPARPFCSGAGKEGGGKGPISKYEETYGKLDKLDFMTAAKILFTSPPKHKKFGFDFHMVQFFFACMPSLAVYLVAQYSRYEMRRMEADLEKKRKVEEEAKAKEDELKAIEEKENNPVIQDLSKVNVRLDKLEEVVKEIVLESKKQLNKTSIERPNDSTEKKDDDATENGKMDTKLEKNNLEEKDQNSK